MYDYFLDEHYNTVGCKLKEESGELYSHALYLKKFLSEEIAKILTKSLERKHNKGERRMSKKLPGGLEKELDVKVKDIQFAYNNHAVINILKKRGTAIAQCKWDQVKVCDDKLTQLV
jgi:hypothetical protein